MLALLLKFLNYLQVVDPRIGACRLTSDLAAEIIIGRPNLLQSSSSPPYDNQGHCNCPAGSRAYRITSEAETIGHDLCYIIIITYFNTVKGYFSFIVPRSR